MLVQTRVSSDQRNWLFSRRADFWFASAGASVALLAAVLVILWHGDREFDAFDFVLSEFHLGATYGAVIQRRMWRDRWIDVLLIPLLILLLTYALSMTGQAILLTSIAMYAAVWHRGRQSLGVARFYQRGSGGPVSRGHSILFRGAIYLPMLAAMLAYTHLAPTDYEGKPYFAMDVGAEITSLIGCAAVCWVIAYFGFALIRTHDGRLVCADQTRGLLVHPGEYWVVLAHAIAFGSAYALGASNASFVLVLAVYHEVQYLYFTYAMARRPATYNQVIETGTGLLRGNFGFKASYNRDRQPLLDVKSAAAFLVWPVIGFVGAMAGNWLQLNWLAPLGVGGLFCHYWLDGRIWVRRAVSTAI